MGLIREFINLNVKLSNKFDNILPIEYRIDGNSHLKSQIIPAYIHEGAVVYDVGGGKNPYIDLETKERLHLTVVGIDIDYTELEKAPSGIYDKVICEDIVKFSGNKDADVVICQALLEHTKDNFAAFKAIGSILKPGGLAIIFVPSRNAVYARLNLIIPQSVKQKILYTIFPQTSSNQGFPSYYQKCTPKEFRDLAKDNKFEIQKELFYYKSSYFSFFLPVYLMWRTWIILFKTFVGEQAAETFTMVLRKTQ